MDRITPSMALAKIAYLLQQSAAVPRNLLIAAEGRFHEVRRMFREAYSPPRRRIGTRANLSYYSDTFNRTGTKLVRKFYGEAAARRWNQ